MLGLTVGLHTLPDSGALGIGLALAVLLTVLVRPLLVGLVLLPVRLAWGERLFVLWPGLKGAVPILLGTFLLTAGVPDAPRLYAVIVVVVAFSVIVQGGLVPTVAVWLGCRCAPWNPSRGVWASGSAASPADCAAISWPPAPEPMDAASVTWRSGKTCGISFVIRDDQLVPVRGATILRAGNEILALTDPERGSDLTPIFTPKPGTGHAGPAPV